MSEIQSNEKGTRNYWKEPEKIENSFTETKAELKSMNDEQISDLEVRMMEITQSGKQTESQMKQELKQYKRHVG